MADSVGIILNGVTGRMGLHQHLERALLSIRDDGGLVLADGRVIVPGPVLVGRNARKLQAIAESHGDLPFTTDLDALLDSEHYPVYFDAQSTAQRYDAVSRAIAAGKHIYCEKPSGVNSQEALELYHRAENAGVRHGVVQDKLWLPGLLKLRALIDSGFFGRILTVKGEFGYWVFTGEHQPAQRPSWNYRARDGGGIVLDMLCHWRYLVDNLFGNVASVSCHGMNLIKERWDEQGTSYSADADDAAFATFVTSRGITCQFNSSWCTRVRRDDLLTLQVDGTDGSAVAGLRECYIQHAAMTPRPVWNPDVPSALNYFDNWQRMPETQSYENAFKAQWKLFLRHLLEDAPFPWDLREGAKGVQLAECGMQSWTQRSWIDVPDI